MNAHRVKRPRWALDQSGVSILGASLCLWAEWQEQWNALAELRADLAKLGSDPQECLKAAKGARTCDFRFRWDHFRDFRTLVGFVKPGLPDWADWNQKPLISVRAAADPLPRLLARIFSREVVRLTGLDPEYLPDPQTHEEQLFYLTIHELCEPPARRGHPDGRRYRDGLSNVVSEAYGMLCEAAQNGDNLSVEEACKRARELPRRDESGEVKLNENGEPERIFRRVTPRNFDDEPRKEWVIVATSDQAAQHRVREALAALLEREPLPERPIAPVRSLPFKSLLNKGLPG